MRNGVEPGPPADPVPRLVPRPTTLLISLLAVVATVGWRRGAYFSGSLDPVVVAKAAVSLVALVLAYGVAQSRPRRRLGTGTLWWLATVLGSSLIGAFTSGGLVAGGVLAVRVAVLAAVVHFLLRGAPAMEVLTGLAWSCGGVAAVASLTGASTLASGRLAGGFPAMAPNELALLAGAVVVLLGWRAAMGWGSWPSGAAAVVFLAVMWLTGSRTAVLMLLLGLLVMGLHIRRPRVGLVVGGLVLVAVAAVGAATTGAVAGFAQRDGTGTSTLDSRFVAWRAALSWAASLWQKIFGGGLSVKIIPVHGPWRSTQPLDSSWVSLLVQAGILGLLVAAGWALWAARGALRAPRSHRVLFLGLLVFLLGRSLLESGLFDATPDFLLFLAVSALAEGGSRDRLRTEEPSSAQLGSGPGLRQPRRAAGRG